MYFKRSAQLKAVNYSRESTGKLSAWQLTGLQLEQRFNLITGTNSSGKSRCLRLIFSFAKMLQNQHPLFPGAFHFTFETNTGETIDYHVKISNYIELEKLTVNGDLRLQRNASHVRIFDDADKRFREFSLQPTVLTLHELAGSQSYPFFDALRYWARFSYAFRFDHRQPFAFLDRLGTASLVNPLPDIWQHLSSESQKQLIEDLQLLGFEINNILLIVEDGYNQLFISEKDIEHAILFNNAASSLQSTIAFLLYLNYLTEKKQILTFVVDDFGKGLDYVVAEKLTKLLLNKMRINNINLILSTSNHLVMNEIDVKMWNILIRNYSNVSALNYLNTRQRFENFRLAGLPNFNLFTSPYLRKITG